MWDNNKIVFNANIMKGFSSKSHATHQHEVISRDYIALSLGQTPKSSHKRSIDHHKNNRIKILMDNTHQTLMTFYNYITNAFNLTLTNITLK